MGCCKTCRFWDRDQAKDKAGRIRSDQLAKCNYQMPKMPDSFPNYSYHKTKGMELKWMAASYGKTCEVHEEYISEVK